jgi:hypothetical protein
MVQENCGNLLPLLQIPDCEKVNNDDIQVWMEKDEQQEVTDHKVIALVNRHGNENDEDNDIGAGEAQLGLDKMEGMSKKVKAPEVALAYDEQQGETTATDVTILREWHDLSARNRSKAGKQTSITHFFFNNNFSVLPYCILTICCTELI